MTYKIKYLPLAVQDLNDIARYLSGFYPKTASRVLKEMREKITKLSDTPKMCEIYPLDPVYRKMVIDQYLVFYQVNDQITESWKSTVSCAVHGICRSIWNKFRFDCCGQYRMRTARPRRRRGKQQPSGLLLSPRFPIFRNVYQESTACRSTICTASVGRDRTRIGRLCGFRLAKFTLSGVFFPWRV